jgi:hypothetical protein
LTKWCNIINAVTIIEEKLELVAPFLPINRHQERATKFVREIVSAVDKTKEKEGLPRAATLLPLQQLKVGSRV